MYMYMYIERCCEAHDRTTVFTHATGAHIRVHVHVYTNQFHISSAVQQQIFRLSKGTCATIQCTDPCTQCTYMYMYVHVYCVYHS